ncbi:hypothetical protein HYC85_016750 [Camellia sinensis]|uniref:Uncharacterized protein n=1 Tax=Camellia sinensis TaxID=4442 RepID=A0A7J7H0H7_CAMSI|nr:hypothetical protein HYC85_016750 [Camellia sinensis]
MWKEQRFGGGSGLGVAGWTCYVWPDLFNKLMKEKGKREGNVSQAIASHCSQAAVPVAAVPATARPGQVNRIKAAVRVAARAAKVRTNRAAASAILMCYNEN